MHKWPKAPVSKRTHAKPKRFGGIPVDRFAGEIEAIYGSRARTTRCRMRQALRELVELAGPRATTGEITAGLVARFAANHPERKAATTNGLLAAVRAAANLAEARGWIAPGQLAGVRWSVAETDPPRRRHHSAEEIGRVLAWLKERSRSWTGQRLYALTAVWAFTGLRRMEALRLRVEDVDLERGFLFVRPNGRSLKTLRSASPVPIPAALEGILRDWIGRLGGSEWLFPGEKKRGPWVGGGTGKRAGDRLRQAGEAVGVTGMTPHSLRHSLATILAARDGRSERQIQLLLRHSNSRTQARYIHPDLQILRGLLRAFRFEGAPPEVIRRESRRVLPRRRLRRKTRVGKPPVAPEIEAVDGRRIA